MKNWRKFWNQTIIRMLKSLRLIEKDEYPEGLKYERRESFKSLIRKMNDKNDKQK